MRVTKITVSYAETHSFGNHHNVRPSVTYEADVGAYSAVSASTRELARDAVLYVRELVDDALEKNGYSPAYNAGNLYRVMISHRRKAVFLVQEVKLDTCPVDFLPSGRATRWDAASKLARLQGELAGYAFLGDPSPDSFPELEALDLSEASEDEIPF